MAAKKARAKTKMLFRDVIIKYPYLSWADFERKLGKQFPSATRNSFAMVKSVLRSEGYGIPVLDRSGSSAPKCGPATKRGQKKSTQKTAVKAAKKEAKVSKPKTKRGKKTAVAVKSEESSVSTKKKVAKKKSATAKKSTKKRVKKSKRK